MSGNSKIEWTYATWNPIVGCSIVSPGCTNCYAMKLAGRRLKNTPKYKGLTQGSKSGPVWTGETRLWEKALYEPLGWKKPRKIFVNSEGDLFHESISDNQICDVLCVIAQAQQHNYQILTKRAARMKKFMSEVNWRALGFSLWPAKCIWIGVSTERQQEADERIPLLLQTPAAVRFISAEPLLGPIDLCRLVVSQNEQRDSLSGELRGVIGGHTAWVRRTPPSLDWVIAGYESGSKARPGHPQWARDIRDQCEAANIPFFFKQWGTWAPSKDFPVETIWCRKQATVLIDGRVREWQQGFPDERLTDPRMCGMTRVGKKAAGRLLDGKEHNEFPQVKETAQA